MKNNILNLISWVVLTKLVLSLHVVELEDDRYPRRAQLRTANDYDPERGDEITDDDEHHEIVSMLEERYKFVNDNTSTRFKIANDERHPGKEIVVCDYFADFECNDGCSVPKVQNRAETCVGV